MNDNLLAGNPVKVDFFYIHPWKLRDIVNPELRYYEHLFLFFVHKEDLGYPEELIEGYDILELIRARAVIGEAFEKQVLDALKAFTHEDFILQEEEFRLGDNILRPQHWEQIKNILAEENFIDLEKKEDDFNPANKRAAEFRKRIEETRKLVSKYKKKNEVSLGFLVNRLCAKSQNINLITVWDFTLYQFKQQLDALIVNESYDFNMMALANGNLDPKKHKIVHWTENK